MTFECIPFQQGSESTTDADVATFVSCSKCFILIDQIELDIGSASRPCLNAHFFPWVITGRAWAMFDAQFYFLVVRHRPFDDGFDHGTQNSCALPGRII